jgi:hypothetical protein
LNGAVELLEFADSRAEEMPDLESDRRIGLIELVGFVCDGIRYDERQYGCKYG